MSTSQSQSSICSDDDGALSHGMARAEGTTSPGQNMVKYVKSNDDWVTLMKEDKLVVIDFTSSGSAFCSFVASFFEAMPKDYPNIIFAIVDLDKKDEIAAPLDVDVNALPIFQFYKRGEKLKELAGKDASVDKLTKNIAALDLGEASEEEILCEYEEESGSEELHSDSVEDPESYTKSALPREVPELRALPRQNKFMRCALPRRKGSVFNVTQKRRDFSLSSSNQLEFLPEISLNVEDEDETEQGEAEAEATAREKQLHNSVKKQKNSLADEYTRLSLQFESQLIQHKLAMEYFDFRSYYFVFLPVTLIATSITIIGFLISGNTQTEDNGANGDNGAAEDSVGDFEPLLTGQSKQILSLVVGILGAISTLFNAIGKRTNYQSQSDMHRSAVKALEKICLTVEFEREWFDRKVLDLDSDIETAGAGSDNVKTLADSLGADLKTHQASFKAMLDACCDSPVPYEVAQAFTLLEQIFCLEAIENGDSFNPLMYHYHKLWKEYSTYRLWPLKAPSIKVSKKVKQWKKERAKYGNGDDDDEEESVWSCFCCGKYWQIRGQSE